MDDDENYLIVVIVNTTVHDFTDSLWHLLNCLIQHVTLHKSIVPFILMGQTCEYLLTKGGGEIFTQDLCLLLYHVEVCDHLVITLELLGTHFYLLTMFSTRPFKYRL